VGLIREYCLVGIFDSEVPKDLRGAFYIQMDLGMSCCWISVTVQEPSYTQNTNRWSSGQLRRVLLVEVQAQLKVREVRVYNLRLSGKRSTHYGFHTVIIHCVFEASWKILKMHRQLNLLKKGSILWYKVLPQSQSLILLWIAAMYSFSATEIVAFSKL